MMVRCAGLSRRAETLEEGLGALDALSGAVDEEVAAATVDEAIGALEARNMVLVGRMVVTAALARTESRGAHQRTDFPAENDADWRCHLSVKRDADGRMALERIPVRGG